MKALQDRLATANLKMSDLRNQVQSLRQDLRMAQKVFQSQALAFLAGAGIGKGHDGDNGFHSG